MDFAALKLELQKRCLDLGQGKRPDERYGEALNNCLSQYPMALWPLTVNSTALDTIADTRVYALTSLTAVTAANQVRRVWIDDSGGTPREIGRYEIQDNAGALSLLLDEEPDAGRDITIEYRTQPASMSLSTHTTKADDDWLLAKAMVSLMGEADWEAEDPEQVIAQVEYWNARAVNRAAQLLGERRHVSRRPRTTDWREFVT